MTAATPNLTPDQDHSRHQRVRVAAMYAVGSSMWLLIPLAVAGVAALIRIHSGSSGAAVLSGYLVLLVMVALCVKLLSSLTNTYVSNRYADDNPRKPHRTPFEPFLVVISIVALIAVTIWFNTGDACSVGVFSYTCG